MSNEEKNLFNEKGKPLEPQVITNSEAGDFSLITFDDRDVEKIILRTEKTIDLFKKVRIISLKLTNPTDWILQKKSKEDPGSPYLQDKGAEVIRLAWAVDVKGLDIRMEWAEDDRGRYYTFVAVGSAHSKKLNTSVEDIGVCSQRDKFFGKIGNEFKPIEEVDMPNIRRKAVTNLYNRLIKRCVGVLNVTLDDLKAAGFKIEDIPAVEYQPGAAKAEAQLSSTAIEERNLIDRIARILSKGDDKLARAAVKQASQFKSGDNVVFKDEAKEIRSERWISTTLGRIKGVLKTADPDIYTEMFGAQEKAEAEKKAKK